MYDHDDGVEACIPTSDLEIDTFYDPDLFDELALDETSLDVPVHKTPVRGNVRSISSRPCSPGLAPRMARVGQDMLGSVGDGIGSDQVVSCREQYPVKSIPELSESVDRCRSSQAVLLPDDFRSDVGCNSQTESVMVNSIFVRGGVKTNCGRPFSPEGASWLLREEQNTLGPDGDGTISDQIVESCRENHRYSVVDVDQPINDVMPEIVPISYPVDVELSQNDSCCVDTNVDCIPCLRSVNNVDAVCGLVDEQENRGSRIAESPMCTTCIDAPVEYIYMPP